MQCCDQSAHIRERLTANRSDLTLQGGPNQHDTYLPRRTIQDNHSPPRLELHEPAQRHIVSRALRETAKSKHIQPLSPRPLDYPRSWVQVPVLSKQGSTRLTVSTTSYSRHTISIIQSPISTADNGRSLIDTDGAKTPRNPVLLPYLYINIIPRPVSKFPFILYQYTTHVLEYEYILYLASNRKLLDF